MKNIACNRRSFMAIVLVLVVFAAIFLHPLPTLASPESQSIVSGWAVNPPSIDGKISAGEWENSATLDFSHGRVYFKNNGNYLYLLTDVIGDTGNDSIGSDWHIADWAALYFDVNKNSQLTSKVDESFAYCGGLHRYSKSYFTGVFSIGGKLYLGWTPCIRTSSSYAYGFGSTPASSTAHRFFETAIDLREVQSYPGQSVRMAIQVYSYKPQFSEYIPSNYSATNGAIPSMLDVSLATQSGGSVSCDLSNVPMYYQGWPSGVNNMPHNGMIPWEDEPYGNPSVPAISTDTIGRWGCRTTAQAMALQYFFNRQNVNITVNPKTWNDHLRSVINGYIPYNYNQDSMPDPAQVVNYARQHGVSLTLTTLYNPSISRLASLVCEGSTAVLGVKSGGHWVLATGTDNSGQTLKIHDSIWGYGPSNLSDHYGNTTIRADVFTPDNIDGSALQATIHSPIELLVTDPIGRKVGYDPRTDTTYNEIPDSGFTSETVTDENGNTRPPLRVLNISLPLDGNYSIEVIGTGNGPYEIDFTQTTSSGAAKTFSLAGNASPTSDETKTVALDPNFYIYLPAVVNQ